MITGRQVMLAPMEPRPANRKTSLSQNFPAEARFCIVTADTTAIVGEVNYSGFSPDTRDVEIGINIDYVDRGKGYGEDALYHFLTYLFDTMKLKCVKLAVVVGNRPARRLYAKLGFVECGLVENGGYDVEREELVDVMKMELSRDDWERVRRSYGFTR